MNHSNNIIHNVPFFKHLNSEESALLFRTGRVVSISSGQYVDIKKSNSFSIVLDGIFEIESVGNRDIVYLPPGAFFGFMPFTEIKRRGNIRALVNSRLFIISEDEIFRFFLQSTKALRGYIKILNRIGFDISDAGREYFNSKMKMITVYSGGKGAGKSFLASALGLSLAAYDKTVLLDLSYSGKSLFEFFGERLTAPLSEKPESESSANSLIEDRLVKVNDNLYILNISFSSRVKTDPDIISPILFVLSRKFRYIIADLSDDDPDLRGEVFSRTDFIFNLESAGGKPGNKEQIFANSLRDGQRLLSVRNNFTGGREEPYYGGFVLEKCSGYENPGGLGILEKFASSEALENFRSVVSRNSRALVLQSLDKDSVFFAGLLSAFDKAAKSVDYIYSSSYSFFISALYQLLGRENLEEGFRRFYSREQMNRNCDITFPEKHVFKSGKLIRYCEEMAGSKRAEMFGSLPLCRLADTEGNARIFSSGKISRLMAASFVSFPLFEPVSIQGKGYYSGFPLVQVSGAHLYRTEADEFIYVSVRNREKLKVDNNIIDLYASYLNTNSEMFTVEASEDIFSVKNLTLEVSSDSFRFDKIFEETEILAEKLVVRI